MKVSVSLPESSVQFINIYLKDHPAMNRSQIIQQALELLRMKELERDYQEANKELNADFECAAQDGLHEAW